ncbi:MAG: DedA family protein [Roseofilum sp. SBFL]|uniref:DedA family protein n=1 Tax=unclassified Roseofilum TaxID=2620099 RepID=UPI001B03AF4D|nr:MULTISPECIES: DedA family protein [unclassified Roseofilum]MBP0015471.1 DedA family protein [Roseofilum sp. SID3]MBP0023211.1 DedA family protein [Roseofilum sp. SID2]MBP0039897.1 DedA family protein [Roseofilum sp. SID1]MBP0041507.1 DedA family protein [Roseofilum sp. SBFL]
MSLEFLSLDTIQSLASQYGYWTIFLGIMLENTGLPLPGETITLVGGFLAGSGEMVYWRVLASAIAGAAIGDSCGYWIGRTGGWPLLLKVGKFFRVAEHQLENAKSKFQQNAARAVFLGRFIALLRIFAGPIAGIVEMPYPKFLLCNVAGATLWASVMVSLAFFVGHLISLEQLIAWVGQFAILALLLLIAWIVVPLWLEARASENS